MDDPLLMGVLHRLADGNEQIQPLPRREVVLVAIAGDRHPFDEVHDEVGPAGASCTGVQHAGDVRVVHQGQRLPFGLEAGDNLFRVHAGLDQLDGDEALDRLGLLRHPDAAHAAFADLLQKLIRTDDSPNWLGDRQVNSDDLILDRGFEKTARHRMRGKHFLDLAAKIQIARAGLVEVGRTLLWRSLLQRRKKAGFEWYRWFHGSLTI